MNSNTEYDLLLKRFRHLLESDIISEYDEVDPHTGNYKKDIKEFDKYFQKDGKMKGYEMTKYVLFKCLECGKYFARPEQRADGRNCPCGGHAQIIAVGERRELLYSHIGNIPNGIEFIDNIKDRRPDAPPRQPSSNKELVVTININGLDEIVEQLKIFNQDYNCDIATEEECVIPGISNYERDFIISRLLSERRAELQNNPDTRDEKLFRKINLLHDWYQQKNGQHAMKMRYPRSKKSYF